MIETKNLTIGYNGLPILKKINITAEDKSCLCIFGENGCGKTTLLKTLLGFIPPIEGTATLNGYDIRDKWNIRRISASVFQTDITDPGFPILAGEAVLLGRYRENPLKTTEEDLFIAEKAMKECNVWNLKDIPYGRLSGGQKQRINIALALASRPEILFLDEPVTFLDTQSRDLLCETINRLKKSITLIVVSHYRYIAEQTADRIISLEQFR